MPSEPKIPVIDFSPFINGSSYDREQVASAIDAALSSVGFIYLTNHGINQTKVDKCFEWSRRFFTLTEAERKSVNHSHHRGYSGIGNEKVRQRVCSKEGFDFGNPKDDAQPNIWPSDKLLPGFSEFMEDFFQNCEKLVHQLLECLSVALNLSKDDSLAQYHASSLFNMSLLHYPALPASLLRSQKQVRNPAHSDFGTLTLLFQDDIGGLEIADPDSADTTTSAEFEKSGRFIHAEPKPETVVINIGYLLMRWSNGRWKNTIHRVAEPPCLLNEQSSKGTSLSSTHEADNEVANDLTPERYSIPFFASPDLATVVEALPGCWDEDVPKRWKPINAGEYLHRKRENTYV